MKHLRFATLGLAAALALLAPSIPADAQYAPGGTVLFVPAQSPSYQASVKGLAVAASGTDFFVIKGKSGGGTVYITSASCNGTSTAAAAASIVALKRSTADSSGTKTNPTAVALSSSNAAAGAVVEAYTVNPTLGVLVGNLDTQNLVTVPAASTAPTPKAAEFIFGSPTPTQPVALHGTAEEFALNANAASLTSGAALNCVVKWFER